MSWMSKDRLLRRWQQLAVGSLVLNLLVLIVWRMTV